jgi:preprotein translocase subunit SecE
MAKSITATANSGDNLGERMKAWPERVKTFYNDVRAEMRKVSAPSLKEVQGTTTVVVITVFLFAMYFWLVDNIIGNTVNYVFKYFTHR